MARLVRSLSAGKKKSLYAKQALIRVKELEVSYFTNSR